MKTIGGIGLLLILGGCASQPCDLTQSGSACRQQWLLHQNDLLQAKILVLSGGEEGFELAHALLDRAGEADPRGEVELYRGLLLMREEAAVQQVLDQLRSAAEKRHPHAIALLYKVYSEPFLIRHGDAEQADLYRQAYADLDVARSGYPSFQQALEVVDRLVAPRPSAPPMP